MHGSRPAAAVLAAALTAAALTGACRRQPATYPTGSLSLSLQAAQPRAIVPAGDFAPATYGVDGTGPDGATFSLEVSTTAATVTDLAAGSWTLAARGRNAAGLLVAEGIAAAEVAAGETAEVTVVLGASGGTGALDLSVTWNAAIAAHPLLEGSLTATDGTERLLPLVLTGADAAAGEATDVPAGWYTLVVRLYDGPALVAGGAEAVLVRASATTSGALDLGGVADPVGSGGLGVTLAAVLPAAKPLAMAGQLDEVEPLDLFCVETGASAGAAQRWYLDGELFATGFCASLAAPAAVGSHRLDAVCLDDAAATAGSASHRFAVVPEVPAGALSANAVLADGEGGVQGLRGARCAVLSPDGTSLYATGYDADSVVVFGRSPAGGLLRFAARIADGAAGVGGLDGADGVVVSPDGRHVYVAGTTADAIAAFARDATGALAFVGSVGGLDGVRALAVSPDGAHLYAALSAANAVAVLARDASTGALTAVGSVAHGAGGVVLLETPTEVAVSPDGAHVYVTAYASDAVSWFARDAATGALAPLGAVRDGAGGVETLNGAHGVALTADGSSLLVASYYDRAVSVFARNTATGSLQFASAAVSGAGGVAGLSYARDVVVAPDGLTVHASGGGDDAVATFRFDPATRALAFLGATPVPDGPRGLALSSDGLSLYVCAATAGALAALRAAP